MPKYSALSYTWGDENQLVPIADHDRRFLHHITENLESALRHLREQKDIKGLWIDALCINQNDDHERSEQVMHMGLIFERARNVRIWLGKASINSDEAMDFVHQITDLRKLDNIATNPSNIKEWKAFVMLMNRPWFSRRWIVQEVVFARRAVVHCGMKEVRWPDFVDAVALFGEKIDQLRILFEKSMGNSQLLANGRNIPARLFITATSNILGKGNNGRIKKLCSMEMLVMQLASMQVSEPRDTIYALVTLANDVNPPFKDIIDYKKSVAKVCKDLISHVANTYGTLDIICRPWAPMEYQLPSWIPTNTGPHFSWDSKGLPHRIKADNLVGPPNRPFYNASGRRRRAEVKFNDNGHGFIMSVKGFEVDRLRSIEEPAINGVIPKRWLELALSLTKDISGSRLTSSTFASSAVPEMFWRTLVADRNEKGNLPLDWYLRACEESYRLCSIRSPDTAINTISPGDIDTLDTVKYSVSPGNYDALDTVKLSEQNDDLKSPAMVTSFLSRVQSVTWNRRMAITEQNALAIVPSESRDSDSICILFGCSIPVILREHENDVWELLGECYVNAPEIMNGEVADYGLKGRVDDFKLK